MAATFPHGYHVTLSWPGHGGAILDATGGPPIEGGAPSVEVAPADAERTPRLLDSAKKHCLVANALAVPVTLDVAVVTPATVSAV